MRVLLANKFFFHKGGSESVMFQERDFLIRQGADVIEFSMRDGRNEPSRYTRYFVSPKNYRANSAFDRARQALSLIHSREAVSNVRALIDRTRPDLMHCHNVYHQLTPSIIGVAKACGIPVVLTLHDPKPVCPVHTRVRDGQVCSACLEGDFWHVVRNRCASGSMTQSIVLYAEATVQRWLGSYEKVDRFLAPSRFMRAAMLGRFSPEKVVLLYNGVDTAKIKPSVRDDGYVLFCGRLAPGKGADTLLQAHEASGCLWPVVVAGSGPLARELQSRFRRNVRFRGQLSGSELSEAIAGASVVAVPSAWIENCPMAALEAMAHGKAVVGSRVGGIPELITDGVNGLLFDAEDVSTLSGLLDRLMAAPLQRARMGMQGRTRAERDFSLDAHNTALMNVYASVLGSGARQVM